MKQINRLKNPFFKVVFLGALVLGMIITACLDQIELDIPKGSQQALILQGRIIKGTPSRFELKASRLFDFTLAGLQSVSLKTVELSDESGNSLKIPARGTGLYIREFEADDPAMRIEFGKSYKIKVEALDGNVYESTLEPLLPSPPTNTLKKEKALKTFIVQEEEIQEDSVIRFSMDVNLRIPGSSENSLLKWDVQRVFKVTDCPSIDPVTFDSIPGKICYVTEELDVLETKLLNGKAREADVVPDFFLYDDRLDYHFAEGYYANIIQETLTESAFKYWSEVAEVTGRDGNMFESPVGAVRSNYTNLSNPSLDAFGYFYATVHDTIRVYVSPTEFGSRRPLCPPIDPPPVPCPILFCCDCLHPNIEFSTTDKPDWWIE